MTPSTSPVPHDEPRVHETGVGHWRSSVQEALADGWRFAGLWAQPSAEGLALRAAFTRGPDFLLLHCLGPGHRFHSIVDLVPAAQWDEREAHDLYGATFPAHTTMRPLVEHPDDLSWTVPVRGPDQFQVAVGPIHAGVIESGHFRFHVVGERILHLDLQLFYKHRGLERAAEGRLPQAAIAYVQRACGADAVANTVAFAQACESAQGLMVTPDLARTRTLLLELERLYNHLNDVAAICAGIGFAAGNMLFASFKERAQRLNHSATGHRLLFDTIHVGRSDIDLSRRQTARLRTDLLELREDVNRTWHEMQFSGSAQERFTDVGVLSEHDAARLGAVGPTARASGIAIDARTHSPRLMYDEFRIARPHAPTGDVTARLEMRAAELPFVFDCLDTLLDGPISPASARPARTPGADGLATVESPRGQTLCTVRLDAGTVARVHLRTGSYANWPVLAHVVPGNLLPDFPLINKSFELCYACTDR